MDGQARAELLIIARLGNIANLMSASATPLLRLEGIKKVFLTDEVETVALAGVHLEVDRGEYTSMRMLARVQRVSDSLQAPSRLLKVTCDRLGAIERHKS
jgi:hypothetical protein